MSRYQPIMFLGTGSSVGKSLISAAMCRIALRKGIRVAPFKAQNMSLNSWICPDGGEIGRAQALQAKACGLEADVRFNPVLLKPLGNGQSQLILMGKPAGNFSWTEYKKMRPEIWACIKSVWRSLRNDFEWVIIEGAGSPAEINLRSQDVTNMAMAIQARANAILIADIDHGGAFAALYGTLLLLSRKDRNRIKAFLLNRFRGDPKLLDPALSTLTGKTGRPFLGIVPMLDELKLPQEDSASHYPGSSAPLSEAASAWPETAVLDWPFASNLTDFEPLAWALGPAFRLIKSREDFGNPDLLILPGSRNLSQSRRWLAESGIEKKLRDWLASAKPEEPKQLLGVCGGLELLGHRIEDSGASGDGSCEGLRLLPINTAMQRKKITRLKRAVASDPIVSGQIPLDGYEIHHGQITLFGPLECPVRDAEGEACAWAMASPDNSRIIWGSWLHGLFANNAFRHAFLKQLARRTGKELPPIRNYCEDDELDRLAQAIGKHIDMALLESLAGMR